MYSTLSTSGFKGYRIEIAAAIHSVVDSTVGFYLLHRNRVKGYGEMMIGEMMTVLNVPWWYFYYYFGWYCYLIVILQFVRCFVIMLWFMLLKWKKWFWSKNTTLLTTSWLSTRSYYAIQSVYILYQVPACLTFNGSAGSADFLHDQNFRKKGTGAESPVKIETQRVIFQLKFSRNYDSSRV